MNFDKSSSRKYDIKYASHDALNTKKRYPHVQSKVKAYIDNLKKDDLKRRREVLIRHRSEPCELAQWRSRDDSQLTHLNESGADWKLALEKKDSEFDELKSQLRELKEYGDTMKELFSDERSRRIELQKTLAAIRESHKIVNSCTWSDPGADRIEENDNTKCRGINNTGEIVLFIEDEVLHDSNECFSESRSQEEIAEVNDETILLQPVEAKPTKKGVKYRLRKVLRCCAPCIIKPKVV